MSVDYKAIWEAYVASWMAESVEEKRALFETCLTPGCVYIDPLARTEGWAELAAYMIDFQRQVPGGHFVTQQFIAHHGTCIATWKMLNGDAVPIGEGISYGEFGEGDRLARMAGFFGAPGSGD
jgi:hypothetical protein